MLRSAMNDRKLDIKARMQAAIALLPFEHQKLGESGKKEQKDNAAQGVAKGRFAPATPPPTQLKLVR
jgi:phage terminase small subunit